MTVFLQKIKEINLGLRAWSSFQTLFFVRGILLTPYFHFWTAYLCLDSRGIDLSARGGHSSQLINANQLHTKILKILRL